MYWVGMDTDPAASPDELADFNRFYTETHVPEVVAANGFAFASRYELLDPDPRGDFGPRWLAVYEMPGEAEARAYAERNDGPASGRPNYTPVPPSWKHAHIRWRMLWRQLATHGTSGELPESIFLVGMNVPPETDAAGLAEFNHFYTTVHVPEVVAAGGYVRGSRYELYRAFAHPEPGCPRFCAIYEADTAATEANQRYRADPSSQPARPRMSSGPPTWEAHDTLWRLVYRRLPAAARLAAGG